MTILVTGATGNVGAAVITALPDTTPIRAAVRDPHRAREKLGDKPEYVTFDFADPATFGPAFNGVQRMFLVRPPEITDVASTITPAINAAREAGVQHIVFLSLQGVEQNRFVPHRAIEDVLRASGIDWTFLRAGFFMQNLNTTHRDEIRYHDEIFIPAGHSRTSFIDVRDIGAAAAHILTTSGYEQQAYTLTGAEALDYHAVAAILSSALGRPIRYVDPALPRFVWSHWRQGRPFRFALVMAMLYTLTRRGMAAEITPDLEQLIGRDAIRFEQYANDYRNDFMP